MFVCLPNILSASNESEERAKKQYIYRNFKHFAIEAHTCVVLNILVKQTLSTFYTTLIPYILTRTNKYT